MYGLVAIPHNLSIWQLLLKRFNFKLLLHLKCNLLAKCKVSTYYTTIFILIICSEKIIGNRKLLESRAVCWELPPFALCSHLQINTSHAATAVTESLSFAKQIMIVNAVHIFWCVWWMAVTSCHVTHALKQTLLARSVHLSQLLTHRIIEVRDVPAQNRLFSMYLCCVCETPEWTYLQWINTACLRCQREYKVSPITNNSSNMDA